MKKRIAHAVQRFLGPILQFLSSISKTDLAPKRTLDLLYERAVERSADFAISDMKTAMMFTDRQELWKFVLKRVASLKSLDNISFLEFGVFQGDSINFFAQELRSSLLYGFDSFQGLQEDWSGYVVQKGYFDLGGKLPKVQPNVRLIPGWYEDSLPKFLRMFEEKVDILHIDCDTFTPTKFILTSLAPRLKPDSILIFDEYIGYPGWENHEHKAWTEFSQSYKVEFEYIAFTNLAVALQIKKLEAI